MGNGLWRAGYLRNPPQEGDQWLKANAVLGSILAIAMLAMAVAGLYLRDPTGRQKSQLYNGRRSERCSLLAFRASIVVGACRLAVDDARKRAQAGQGFDDEREALRQVVAGAAIEPNLAILAAMTRKLSCLISCSHRSPQGGSAGLGVRWRPQKGRNGH